MRIALTGGAYQARSVIASAQRCVNLYGEAIPESEDEPGKFAYYPTPGLSLVHTLSTGLPARGMYTATNGNLFVVSGSELIELGSGFNETPIGYLTTDAGSVSMADNTLDLIVVDGTGVALDFTFSTATLTQLTSAQNYNGSTRVDYMSTYFLFNEPGTPQFFCSVSESTTIDPLYFANKAVGADYLIAAVEARGYIWLIGKDTSEVWTLSGASDFPFQVLPGVLVEHGCGAPYSIAKADGSIYFLSMDLQGQATVLRASGDQASIVSTSAISAQIATYGIIGDAVGYCYQQQGHVYYVLTFPSADATWVYDESNGQWHQWAWMDNAGVLHRHRSSCFANFNGVLLVGDWQNGNIYALDLNNYTDNGQPIQRLRSFPHIINDGKRVSYKQFSADMECGNTGAAGATVNLAWSDDRGATFGGALAQSIGTDGTLTQPKWSRLGMARDRVFQLSWNAPVRTALQGAYIDAEPSST